MNDKELIELAAKAAGYKLEWRSGWDGTDIPRPIVDCEHWEPLHDDGDALRLAGKLAMNVYIDTHPEGCACTEVWSTLHPEGRGGRVVINHDGDADAATRRAIVCLAAEIGKGASYE